MVKVPLPLNASTKHYQQTQALMGATRLASGIKERLIHYKQRLTDSSNYTSACKPFPKCPTRDASPPLEVAFGVCPSCPYSKQGAVNTTNFPVNKVKLLTC